MSEWTQEEVLEWHKTGREPRRDTSVAQPVRHRQASPRGTMNKTEARYAAELTLLLRAGEIQWYAFEPVTLRLAKRTAYTPDFLIQHNDGSLEFIETKGRKDNRYWCTEDAKIKIKVAAKMFGHLFRFKIMWQDKSGVWQSEAFGNV